MEDPLHMDLRISPTSAGWYLDPAYRVAISSFFQLIPQIGRQESPTTGTSNSYISFHCFWPSAITSTSLYSKLRLFSRLPSTAFADEQSEQLIRVKSVRRAECCSKERVERMCGMEVDMIPDLECQCIDVVLERYVEESQKLNARDS